MSIHRGVGERGYGGVVGWGGAGGGVGYRFLLNGGKLKLDIGCIDCVQDGGGCVLSVSKRSTMLHKHPTLDLALH